MISTDLRAWRKAHGLRVKQLAAKLGISWHTLSEWEQGRHRIPGPVRLALERLEALDKDAAKKRKRRALERSRRQSLEVSPEVREKFY